MPANDLTGPATVDPTLIYKICPLTDWDVAQRDGFYRGSPDDLRDGFIHFSARHQLRGTAAKHFRDKEGLVLITVDALSLGAALRWETSRGGDLFPHLYGPLPIAAARAVTDLPLDATGIPLVPEFPS
jgi:uncharacterized protein (DUF952 family)